VGEWRQDCDRAILEFESSRSPEARLNAARLLFELATDSDARPHELTGIAPQLLDDVDERIRHIGVDLAPRVFPPEEAEALLARRVQDPSDSVRLEAVGQLADLARPSTRTLLAAALEDPDFNVRFEAARGMAALHDSAGLEVLIEALQRSALRFRALGALAELGDARALPAIRRVHRRWIVSAFDRCQAAGAMARLGDAEGASWLLQRTRRYGGVDRGLAVELLGEVKADGAWERLRELLLDPSDPSRGAAARGLGRLGDVRASTDLVRILEAADLPIELRMDAAEGLCLLGDAASRARVEAAAESWPDPEGKAELRGMLGGER
jgi:HEAT repeat protein